MLLLLVPLAVAFWVYSVVDCAMQPPTRHRGVSKPVWLVIVMLLPVIGGVLWFVTGRARAVTAVRAPDDDPAFLHSLGSHAEQDERIRRLEEELARLDAEDAGGARDADAGPAASTRPAASGRPAAGAPPAGGKSSGAAGAAADDGDDDARGRHGSVG